MGANEKDLSTALETLDVGKMAETSTSEIGTDEILTELNGCANCKRQNAKKRCAKRHTKCMNKLFCDGVCEKAAHTKSSAAPPPENNENSDQALNVAANAKLEKAKAAEKKKKA